jgi:hypothetical protein
MKCAFRKPFPKLIRAQKCDNHTLGIIKVDLGDEVVETIDFSGYVD